MADLFEKYGINPNQAGQLRKGVDLFEKHGIEYKKPESPDARLQREHPFIYEAGKALSESPIGSLINSLSDVAKPINKTIEQSGIPAFAGGVVQGAGNLPISVLNTPSYVLSKLTGDEYPELPYFNLQQFTNPEDQFAFSAGDVASNFIPGTAAIKASKLARPHGYAGILSDILRGAGIGYATSGAQDNRELGAALGGALSGAAGISTKATGERIRKSAEELKKDFNASYNHIWDTAKSSGIEKVKVPEIKSKNLLDRMTDRQSEALREFLKDPVLKKAQDAQSELGAFMRATEKKSQGGALLKSESNALNLAKQAQKKIRGAMHESFIKGDRPDLWKDYIKTTKEYGDYTHVLHNPNIKKALKGKLSDTNLSKELQKRTKASKEFMEKEGHLYPEIGLQKNLTPALSEALKYGAGIVGANQFLKNYKGHNE